MHVSYMLSTRKKFEWANSYQLQHPQGLDPTPHLWWCDIPF
jgi:hypothetical protein